MSDPITDPSGAPVVEPVADPVIDPPKNVVAYATHQKLLSEKKKLQEERDSLKAAQDKAIQDALEAEGKKDELIEYHKKKAQDAADAAQTLERQITGFRQQETDNKKLSAFLKAVPGQVDSKYWGLVDLDKVTMNPETGEIEASSVQQLVDNFQKEHPILVTNPNKPKSPNEFPAGNSGNAAKSLDDWNKLPRHEQRNTPIPDPEGKIPAWMKGNH